MTPREVHWKVSGRNVEVRIEGSKDRGTFHLAGRSGSFRILAPDLIEIDGKRHRFYSVQSRNTTTVWVDGRTYYLERIGRSHAPQASAGPASGNITALMPGKILRLEVAIGDAVTEKQPVATMESMKMESALHAPIAGRVSEILCRPGQIVEMGELLMVIE